MAEEPTPPVSPVFRVTVPLLAAVVLSTLLMVLFPPEEDVQWVFHPAAIAGFAWAGQLWYVARSLTTPAVGSAWGQLLGLANALTLARSGLYAVVAGFLLFYHVYRYAARRARETADSYVAAEYLARYFAPALLPIAAGYHLAHFLGYFLRLAPSLAGVLTSPVSAPASATVLAIPGWFGTLQILLVLLGHVLAIWVAHSRAFDLFPGVFKPIRSQYPTTVVMIFYTMASLWVVVQPFGEPPFV